MTTACTAAAHAAAAHSAVAQAAAGTEMVYTPLNLTAAVHAAAAAHVGLGHTAPHAIGAGKARPGERIESLAVVQTAATHAAATHAATPHAAATRAGGSYMPCCTRPGGSGALPGGARVRGGEQADSTGTTAREVTACTSASFSLGCAIRWDARRHASLAAQRPAFSGASVTLQRCPVSSKRQRADGTLDFGSGGIVDLDYVAS